ncbi:hypothetical protein V5799_010685 [Amblyomma americanum]|uniref:Uncharacterized protein n=1 Tax=Amblyomma americanum TaxID=6943 RepID=A0AAQ4EJI1_AMBAM
MQRKDRSFQDCIELLMPVYLLPFVFGDKVPSREQEWPRVLSVSLLFAVAIIGDETTIFFRLCLYALERYALRMQPLFVCMHLLVFALSLILPSTLIVVFSTVFIERFVTTIHDEIVGPPDQRGGVRIRASSNGADASRRLRGGRAAGRRVRSVSVVSEASEASGSSSVVRQFKMHPDLRRLQAQDAPRLKKEPRKTSFGVPERPQRGGDGRPIFLPVRRIRSLSMQPKRPSSILKRNSSATPPPPTPQSLPPTPPCPLPSPSTVAKDTEERKSSFPTTGFQLTSPLGASHEARDQAPMTRSTQSSPAVASPSAPSPFTALQVASVMSPEASHSVVRGGSLAALTSPVADRPSTAKAGISSPSVRRKGGRRSSPSPRRSKGSSKPSRDHEADASARTRDENAQALNPVQKDSAINARVPGQTVHQSRGLKAAETKREAPYTSKSKEKTVPDPEAKPDTTLARKHSALLSEPRLESVAAEKEPRPEVRGVLKKRYPSIQPSTGSHSGSMLSWKRLTPFSNDVGYPDSRTTPRGVTGAEQQTSSLRMRALTMVARPAFIAGAAYTAIFGNIASFSTLPTRKTVLVTLGCRDDICPVNWQSWLAVSFPVALVCCIICWTSIYSASLVSCSRLAAGVEPRLSFVDTFAQAVVTETPVSFYVVPVSLAASINVMLPVSLPLLVMREYLHTKSAQMLHVVLAVFAAIQETADSSLEPHPLWVITESVLDAGIRWSAAELTNCREVLKDCIRALSQVSRRRP